MTTQRQTPTASLAGPEITTPGPLLGPDGRLVRAGWSRHPYLDCNLEYAGRQPRALYRKLRLKRWDYYAVATPGLFFSVTLADIGYVGTVFAYVVDYTGEIREETLVIPLARGIKLERNADSGKSRFNNGRVRVRFGSTPEERRVRVAWPAFDRGKGLEADFVLGTGPDLESVVTATQMEGAQFFYTRKSNCLPAAGHVTWGGREIALTPETSLGTLDWGRGIWPYQTTWHWGSTSTFLPDGRSFGLNIGSGFGDAPAPDNAVIVGGRVHKLDDVHFDYDRGDPMQPWRMTSPDGRLDLAFTPFKIRVARTNMLVVRSEVHQVFGRYNGAAVTDDGERIAVSDVIGFVEEHHARW